MPSRGLGMSSEGDSTPSPGSCSTVLPPLMYRSSSSCWGRTSRVLVYGHCSSSCRWAPPKTAISSVRICFNMYFCWITEYTEPKNTYKLIEKPKILKQRGSHKSDGGFLGGRERSRLGPRARLQLPGLSAAPSAWAAALPARPEHSQSVLGVAGSPKGRGSAAAKR